MVSSSTATEIERILAGDTRAVARAISKVEDHTPDAAALMKAIFPQTGRGMVVGITGSPGAGKSSLVDRLAGLYRQRGDRVGIVAVDPSSPFTGGAILGDRIRMQTLGLDPGVFIRSMATRGSLGGLAAATREVADVLDAFGFDRILIETVGVGQSELDVARTADSTLLVLVPESGDSIQTLKAGVMEVADVFVVNKADRPGADRLRNDVELMLGLRQGVSFANVPAHHGVDLKRVNPARVAREAAAAAEPATWTPPVLSAVAVKKEGIDAIASALDRHFGYLERTDTLRTRRLERLRERIMDVVEQKVRTRLWEDSKTMSWLEEQLPSVQRGETTPFSVANELLAMSAGVVRGGAK